MQYTRHRRMIGPHTKKLAKSPRQLLNEALLVIACLALLAWPLSCIGTPSETAPAADSSAVMTPAPPIDAGAPAIIVNPDVKVYYDVSNTVMNMQMEEYLVGVLAAEMPASYALEALKAQAVAARTYAYEKMLRGSCGKDGAHICTDSGHCQAYNDQQTRRQQWGTEYAANEARIREAVTSTAGRIVIYQGEPITALFHSTSGGMTEDSGNVYSTDLPYLRAVESKGEENAPRYSATVVYSVKEFTRKIQSANSKAKISRKDVASSIQNLQRFASGRVNTLEIGGVRFTGREIRSLFTLNSTNFEIQADQKNASITFVTRGYGHGVGMSQVGAHAMALEGKNCDQILQHYYTDVQISMIPES